MQLTKWKNKGTCEICDNTDVFVSVIHGNIVACQVCSDKERAAVVEKTRVVESIKPVDSTATLLTEVFNATTVAIIERRALVDQDESIPQEQKEEVFARKLQDEVLHYKSLLTQQREAIKQTESTLRAYQQAGQVAAGKLRSEIRAQLAPSFDISYAPTPITKKVKTIKPVKRGKKVNKEELFAAAKKYDVPASTVQSMYISNDGMSYDDAAKELARLMGKGKKESIN